MDERERLAYVSVVSRSRTRSFHVTCNLRYPGGYDVTFPLLIRQTFFYQEFLLLLEL